MGISPLGGAPPACGVSRGERWDRGAHGEDEAGALGKRFPALGEAIQGEMQELGSVGKGGEGEIPSNFLFFGIFLWWKNFQSCNPAPPQPWGK